MGLVCAPEGRHRLRIGVVIAVILGWMALYLSPAITDYGDRVTRQAEQEADVSLFGAGRFNTIRGGRMTLSAMRLARRRKRTNVSTSCVGKRACCQRATRIIGLKR